MKDNTKRYFFLWLAIFFVGIGLVFADSVVILLGDVNRDGEVNVADITAITNYVHGSTDGYDATAADVNRDGEYNVSDITGVTNIVHYGTPSGSTTESILFFPTTSIEKTYGDAAFSNTIVRAGSTGAVSYTVSPAGVVEVASDGVVTIVGGGTATITATLAANGTFEETSASYTVTVAKVAANSEPSSTMTTEVTAKKTTGDANQSYTGDPLPLVNAGESSAGTLKYKVTTSATPAPSKTDEGWSESVPTASNAGTYYVWYYAEGNDNYEETAVSTEPIVVTIDKASFIPVVTLAGWTYGSPNTPSVGETNTSDGAVTYSYKTGDAEWTTTQPTDVGTHQVKASIAANGNYSAAESAPVDFTISQREATLSWDNTALTYNGAEQAPTCTVSNIVGSDVCTVTVTGGQTNAGSGYTATATALSNSNYKLPAANTTTFSIGNATMTGITAAGFSGDYDGDAHGITLNGVPTDATVKYGTTEGTYDLTISPAYTNAGDAQTVYYQVTKDNYAPVTGSATVTISQKEVTLTWGTTSFTYNGSEQTPTCTAGGLIGSDECTVTVTGGRTNVGSGYTATAESLSNSNYKLPAANTQSFTISKVAPTYTAPAYTSLTYTGSAQNLVSAGTTSHGTITYSTAQNGTYSTTIPTGTNAGDYTVWYKLTGDDNHNDVAATQVTGVTIAKAACTVSLDKTSLNLTNSSATGTINVTCDGDGTVTAESSNTSVATVSVSGNTVTVTAIANGSATITIKVSEGTNHTAYTATDKTVSVTCSGFTTDVTMNPLWYVAQYNMTSATAMASIDNAGYFCNWSTAMTNFAASSTSYSSYTNASKSISGQSGTWHLPVQAEWHSIVPGANTNIWGYVSSSSTTAYKSAYITPKWGYNSTTKAGVSESSWFKYVSATELHAIRFLGTDYCSAWKWEWSGSTLTISATLIGSVANSESAASAWYSSNWSSLTWGNNDSKGAVQRSFYARGIAYSSSLSSGTASSASYYAGSSGYYWSATENGSTNAWRLYFASGGAYVDYSLKSYGFSVRLFRDN